jgi:hypothetical protein
LKVLTESAAQKLICPITSRLPFQAKGLLFDMIVYSVQSVPNNLGATATRWAHHRHLGSLCRLRSACPSARADTGGRHIRPPAATAPAPPDAAPTGQQPRLTDFQREQLLRRATGGGRAAPVRRAAALLLIQRTHDPRDLAQLCVLESQASEEAAAAGRAQLSPRGALVGYHSALQPQHFIAMLERAPELARPLGPLRRWYKLQHRLQQLPVQLAAYERQLSREVSQRCARPDPPPAFQLRARMRKLLGLAKGRASQQERALLRAVEAAALSEEQQLLHLLLLDLGARLEQGLPTFHGAQVVQALGALHALAASEDLGPAVAQATMGQWRAAGDPSTPEPCARCVQPASAFPPRPPRPLRLL